MFLKKVTTLIAVTLVVGVLVALSGCSSESTTDSTTVANGANNAATNSADDVSNNDSAAGNEAASNAGSFVAGSKMHISASGKDIYVNEPTADFIDALGDTDSYFESESCAFQGLDKVYTYKNFVIRTYPIDEVDYVSSIEFRNDSITTSTGCYIGMDMDTVKTNNSEYELESESEVSLVYVDGDTKLSYIFTDGEVSSITYTKAE